ncbi:hypothetical protein FA13DRAFT_1801497 [Coprinellus micaceus]|uniref:F-box domain-containing protein n=1 Tax=Coprinellus micaceus TaxID=71717 RepID=A0A4Y7SDY5_COPMI|nr:hypothetical protein FA13DRAFT_1801497 [Coprinellus micaceus]
MSISTLCPSALALDLWMEVGQHCGIAELISLASTCARLHLVLDSKSSWKNKLEDACDDYGIIAGTYTFQEMTLQDMKNVLSRPQVWTKLVQSYAFQTYPTFDGTIPRCSAVVELPPASYERMTAGGRYLARVQDEKRTFTLQIFNLAPPSKADTLVQPRLVAENLIQGTGGCPLGITSCTTHNAVLVSVTWHDKDRDLYHSLVYYIEPSTQIAWATLARLTFRSRLNVRAHQMTSDFVHFDVGDGHVFSWQFHDNKVLKWRKADADELLQLIVHPRGVIFALRDHMLFISHSSLAPLLTEPEAQADTYIALTADDIIQVMFKCARCTLPSKPCLNPSRQNPLVVDLAAMVVGFPFGIVEVEQADGSVQLELKPVTLYGEITLGFRFPRRPGISTMLTHTRSFPGDVLSSTFTHVEPDLYEGQLDNEGLEVVEFCQISGRAHFKRTDPSTLVEQHAWVDFLP